MANHRLKFIFLSKIQSSISIYKDELVYNYYLLQQFLSYRHLRMQSLIYLILYGISQMIRMVISFYFLSFRDAPQKHRNFSKILFPF